MSTRTLQAAVVALGLGFAALGATPTVAQQTAPPGGEYQKVSGLVALPDFLPGMGTLYVNPTTLPVGPSSRTTATGSWSARSTWCR